MAACLQAIVRGMFEDLRGYKLSYIAAQIKVRSTLQNKRKPWVAPLRASNVCDDGNFSSPKECALAPVPDRMLAHAARAKGTCDDFSVCRAFWSFWAPKGHDITTTKRIYDCRLRVSCIKEYKRLFNVLSVLKRYSPYSLQVNRYIGLKAVIYH